MPSAAKSDSPIWQHCQALVKPASIHGRMYRVVESQEQVATSQLVNGDLEKQALLEELLEPSKPPRVPGTEHLDYLLATPWRYPPLRYGSRFGRRYEPSLFYAGLSEATTLAECAYYRWVFFTDISKPPSRLSSRHTLFEARYKTSRAVQLHEKPFTDFSDELKHAKNYEASQTLGSALRDEGFEAIEYTSARDPNEGLNIALFKPQALDSRNIENPSQWQCETTPTHVTFSRRGQPPMVKRFRLEQFCLTNGDFPKPA